MTLTQIDVPLASRTYDLLHSPEMPRRNQKPKAVGCRFTNQVAESIKALRAAGHRIVAAVSGGPDSTALLAALNTLRCGGQLDLSAAHVNHAMRGEESEADEHFVVALCNRLHIPLMCRRLAVSLDATNRTEGIEATARALRQHFFAEVARELNAPFVATAHTADDHAETVIHRIVRGTGLAGLAGIPESRQLVSGVKLIRPLLRLRRADVTKYLAALGQDFREDHSNLDLSFTRNRLRHELLPYLAKHFNPKVTDALTRLATLAAESQSVSDAHVARLLRRATIKWDRRSVVLRTIVLRRQPPFVICELVRKLWTERGWPLQEIGQAELERVAALVADEPLSRACDLPGFIRVRRVRDKLVLELSVGEDVG